MTTTEAPVLLTGGSGFIGRHLAERLEQNQINTRYLLRNEGQRKWLPATVGEEQIVIGDLMDSFILETALEGCRAVIHAAAKVSFDARDQAEIFAVNIQGTENLVNAALHTGTSRVVHLSSVAALQRISGKTTTLADNWHEFAAATAYAHSKFAAEREVWRGQAEGLSVAVLYPSTVLGAGDWRGSGTPNLFHAAARGRRFAPSGSGGFVGVADVVNAVIFALNCEENGLRILLNAENASWRTILGKIARSVAAAPPTIEIARWQTALLWPLATLAAKLTNGKPQLSRDLHLTAQADFSYGPSNYTTLTGQDYRPIGEVIAETGAAYLKWSASNA